jgi:hypothetical protein
MEKIERIKLLEDAKDSINDAIENIRNAVINTELERNCSYYIIAHLDNWANDENGMDETIPKLINFIMENE